MQGEEGQLCVCVCVCVCMCMVCVCACAWCVCVCVCVYVCVCVCRYVFHGTLLDTEEKDWDRTFDINVKSMFHASKTCVDMVCIIYSYVLA